jgi:hypothetical protein
MNKDFKDFSTVIHIILSERLTDNQQNFLAKLFQLKTSDHHFNINRLLIDLSFESKVLRSFGNKPHQLLIFYKSPIKISSLKTDFIQILDSIDDKTEYKKLSNDDSFFIFGNSRISKLETKQAKKINQLIASYNSQLTASPNQQHSNNSPCRHYHNYNKGFHKHDHQNTKKSSPPC